LSEHEKIIAELQKEIVEKDKNIEILTKHNDELRSLHHSIRTRLDALTNYITRRARIAYREGIDAESHYDLFVALGGVQELSMEFDAETERIAPPRILPKTGVNMLDIIFEYLSEVCDKRKIEFTLNVRGNIGELIREVIPSDKLQVLVSNHTQNALEAIQEAIEKNDNFQHRLVVTIGMEGRHFLFSVFDSGVAFNVETLMKIGKVRVTTRKSLSNGNGFFDSFNIMKECKASLRIIEREPNNNFTKAVAIIFDEQGRYTIETYRAGVFAKSKRYIVIET